MKIENIVNGIDKIKQKTEPILDNILGPLAVNSALIYGAKEAVENTHNSNLEFLLTAGIGAGIALGNKFYYSKKSEKLEKAKQNLSEKIKQSRIKSWLKTGILATALVISTSQFFGNETKNDKEIYNNSRTEQTIDSNKFSIEKQNYEVPDLSELVTGVPSNIKERPDIYDSLNYKSIYEIDKQLLENISLSHKYSLNGRIQRTLRWKSIYNTIEEKYDLPKNIIGAMIMQESCGDPLQPNASSDGGLGLTHQQGTTAQEYGIKIYGDSDKDSDFNHGKELDELLQENHYDFSKIQEFDERAHPIKNLDAAARIVYNGKEIYGSIERGVRFYRGGSEKAKTEYWEDVEIWQEALNDPEQIQEAREDFNKRNEDITFKTYLSEFYKSNFNFGLNEYREEKFK